MSKKHYIKIAALIKKHLKPRNKNRNDFQFVFELIEFMEEDNPKFNSKTFLNALK